MKRLILILLAGILTVPAFTQELSKKEQRKLEKELKKEQQAEAAAQQAAVVDAMVTYRRFVLEANTLKDKRGNSIQVVSNLNFIAADSLTGVIQVGSNAYIGRNGVGGVTVDGSIADFKATKNEKNGSYNITYMLRTPVGNYDVRISVSVNGRADADIRSTTWGNMLRYSGFLVPPGVSRVYKGTSL